MLRVTPIKSGSARGVADYLESRHDAERATGYYEGRAAPSEWMGEGARELGLAGSVDREQLIGLLEGRLPDGTDLTQRGGRSAEARMGTDITLSAPKSFSLMATADPRLVDLWDQSVRHAVDFIEREVAVARKGKGGEQIEHTGSMVMAAYRHEDARTVDGRADPDLHTHVLALNMTHRSDGKWARIDLQWGERMALGKTADFAQKAFLAREVQALGYEIRRTADGFEFAAISDEIVKEFSSRSEQIDEALRGRGINPETATDAQREAACLVTRGDKSQLGEQDQRWEWRTRAREAGVDLDRITQDAARGGPIRAADLSTDAVQSGVRHIAERETVFTRDELRLESLRAGMGNTDLSRVEAAIEQKHGGLIEVQLQPDSAAAHNDRELRHFTTHAALRVEQTILTRTRSGWNQVEPLLDFDSAAAFIRQKEQAISKETGKPFKYSHGQRAALELTLTSPDRFTGGLGYAGVGKTKAMSATVAAYRTAGFHIVGLAPSTKARGELEAAGADKTITMQSYLASRAEEPGSGAQRMYVLDEAGMVSAKDMDQLLNRVEQEGARMIEVGDYRQLTAVEAGSPFEQQCVSGALHHATIHEIIRQVNPELRSLVQQFADGRAKDGAKAAKDLMQTATVTDADWEKSGLAQEEIAEAREKGKVPKAVQREAIVRETAERYLTLSPEERDRTLVASGLNATRVKINATVRAAFRESGEIAAEGITITALRDPRLTREQRTRVELFAAGEIVRLTEGRGRDRSTTDYSIVREEQGALVLSGPGGLEKIWKPTRDNQRDFKVFGAERFEVAVGDQIVFRIPDKQNGINNGTDAKVVRADIDGITVSLKDGREIELDPKKNHAIDYAWCRTVNDLQAATCERIIGAAEGSKAAANLFYVAISRATHEANIVTGDQGKLQKNIEKYADRQTAVEATGRSLKSEVERPCPDLAALRAQAEKELGKAGDLADAREKAEAEKAKAEHPAPEKDQSEKDSGRHAPTSDPDHDKGPAPAAPVKDQEIGNAPMDAANTTMEAPAPDRSKSAGANKNPDRTSDTEKYPGKEKAAELKPAPTMEETGRPGARASKTPEKGAAPNSEKRPVEMPAAAAQETRDMATAAASPAKNQATEKAPTADQNKEAAAEKTAPTAKEKSPTKDPVETAKAPEQAKLRAAATAKDPGKETASEKGLATSIEPPAAGKDQSQEKAQDKTTEATGKRQGVEAPGSDHDKEKDQSQEAAPTKPPTKDRDLDHDLGLER